MKKIKLFCLALLAIVCFNSCEMIEDSSIDHNESEFENNEDVAQSYALLYKDMFKTFMQESRDVFESHGDLDAFCNNFKESYRSRLTSEEAKMLIDERQINITRNSDTSLVTVPDNWMREFEAVLFDENIDCLREKIDRFYNDFCFLNLNSAEQMELKIQLETLATFRNGLVDMVIESYDHENTITRMSPGDRMIWVECSHNMTEKDRKILYNVCIAAWAFLPGIGPFGEAWVWQLPFMPILNRNTKREAVYYDSQN